MSINESLQCGENEFQLDLDSPLAISRSLWDDLILSEEESRSLFEATPARDCMEPERPSGSVDNQVQRDTDSPHSKRRRMLHFSDPAIRNEHTEPLFETFEGSRDSFTERGEGFQTSNPEGTYNNSGCESLEQDVCQSWLEECFNYGALQYAQDEMNAASVFDDQFDISEFCTLQPSESQAEFRQESAPKTASTAKNTHWRTANKLVTPVVYPFALLKPCGVEGDATLNDINQRIRMPHSIPSNDQYVKDTVPITKYVPSSAFSGKTVVSLTKIHTEGNGSITILRTKG